MYQMPNTLSHIKVNRNDRRANGSVYLVTLITVAAIVSMVLVGIKLRSTSNTQSTLVESMVENSNSMVDATEYALASVASNATWATTAQAGTAFDEFTLNGTTYSSTVVDSDTLALPTDRTIKYRIKLISTTTSAVSKSQFDMNYSNVNYLDFLQAYGVENYWPLNESKGDSAAVDTSWGLDGKYLDSSIVGGDTNDEGAQVPAFTSGEDNIEIPWDVQFARGNGSMSVWLKSTQQSDAISYGILGSQYTETGNPNLMLTLIGGGLYGFVSDDGTYAMRMVAGTTTGLVKLDQWHHVTMTWGTAGLTIYLDGVQVAQNTENTSTLDTGQKRNGGERPIEIGSSYISVAGSGSKVEFVGSLAHVAFYRSTQLTADQVAEIAAVKPDLNAFEIVEDSWTMVYE